MPESSLPDRVDRLSSVAAHALSPTSLVGSFFHSDATRGWQGCVVAEPSPSVYLVQLFSWIAGDATDQHLVRLEEMTDWRFYDSAEWMNSAYEHVVERRWDRERAGEDPAGSGT